MFNRREKDRKTLATAWHPALLVRPRVLKTSGQMFPKNNCQSFEKCHRLWIIFERSGHTSADIIENHLASWRTMKHFLLTKIIAAMKNQEHDNYFDFCPIHFFKSIVPLSVSFPLFNMSGLSDPQNNVLPSVWSNCCKFLVAARVRYFYWFNIGCIFVSD